MDDDLQADLAQVPSLKDLIERDLARVPKAPPTPPVRQTISDYAKQFARGAASQLVTAPGQLMVRAGLRPVTRDLGLRLQQQATDAMSQDAKTIGASTFLGDDGNVFGPYPVQKALSAITESAPGLVGLAATGGVAARALQQAKVGERVAGAATAAGVPQAAGRVAGEIAETSPYWIGEGLQAGGANAAEIGQQFRDAERMPVEKMAGSEAFQAAMRESLTASPGWTAQQHVDAVREVMARRAESEAFDKTMASTAGIGAVTSGGALGVIARRLGGQDTGGFLRTTLRGAGRESLQEIPQSVGEQLIANYVTRKYGNPEQPLLEGVGEAMALGGVAGAATGGGLAAGTYPFTRRAQAVEGAPPGSAPTPPQPMAPPPDPAGPLGGAVAAGQQSGAIPINPIGGPVDAPPAPPAASAPTEADSAPEGVFGGERAGQPKQAPGTETRTAWKTLPEVEAFLSAARQQSPQLPAGKPVQRADGLFTFALPGEPEFDMLADARNAPAARAERERRADKALQSVESLTRRLAQASAASQKARDTGDAETAANAESLADVLRDRLTAARNQLEAVSGYPAPRPNVDAGASAGVVGNGGVGAAGRVDLPRGSAAPDGATLAGSAAGGTAPEGLVAAPADGGGASAVVLQNRDRSGVASITQMQSIASNPDPTRLSFSRDFGSGAPVVFANGDALQVQPVQLGREDTITDAQGRQYAVQYAVIEADQVVASNSADGAPNDLYQDSATPGLIRAVAGNGRMAGLQEAYRRGTAADYARGIAGDAALHGVDPAVIEGLSNPVLVRIMRSADVTPDIGDRSNVSGAARLNPVEQARTDMARVNLEALDFTESGDPTPEAVKAFVAGMPEAERSELMTRSGAAGRQAIDRLMAATFAKAYGDDAMIELYAQATDPEARNVLSAMAQAAGAMARLDVAGPFDVRPLVRDAAAAAVNAARRGVALTRFAQQVDMTVAPETRRIVEMFARNARSSRKMAEALRSLADLAYSEATKVSADMFGEVPRRTRAQVIEEVFGGQGREDDAGTVQNAGRYGVDGQGAGGQDGREDQRPAAADADQPQGSAPADGQAFGLTSYTLDELAQQDAELERQAQQEEAQQAEQARRDAAPSADDFVLSGSERAADQAAARGQMELGGEASVDAAAAQAATSPKNDLPEQQGRGQEPVSAPADATTIAREIAKARPFDDVAQVRTAAREAITAQLGTQPVDDLIEAIHEGQYEGIAALGASLPVPVTEDQVGVELSNRAFAGTSHTPERRGRSARREYVRLLVDAWRRAEQAAAADPQAMARITAEFEKLRDGYLSRLKAYLSAHGNVASAMIAGPARFPTEANRKRSATADRRASEANDFLRKGAERLLRAAKAPVDRAPESEVERIRANLAAREAQQERMKAANTALRAGDDAALRGLGFDDAEIARLKTPDFAGRTGFPGYALTNNNAEIRRLRERLEQAEQRAQAAQAGPTSEVVAGVRIEEDAQADRIKLIFDGKPDEETRAALKAAGFRWAPSAGAWQRQLTDNARAAARRILDARRAGGDAADAQADAPAFSRRGWRADFPDAVLGHRQGVAQAHPDYQAAKAGDDRAALRLARDMATDDYVAAIRGALPVDARPTIVPVLAVEAAGNNRIPLAIAKVLGDKLGLPVATNIVQARKVSRGGSDGFHRLANPPNFTGPVVAGDYLILDDTLTQGGTLAQLKTHIEDNGGRVLLASALTGKTYSARIALSNERLTQLRERYGSIEPWWRNTFGYGFDGLTESEARFILSLRDRPGSDTLRDRVVAARVRGVGGVDGRDDSDGRDQPPVASRRATEPATTPYETDLFGNPLPAPPRRARAARPDRAGLPGDVQPAATVQDTEAPAGDYFVRTVVGVTARRRLGANRILTPGDAARATRYLYRSAVERFDGIVTDAAGKPLAVIGGFKGALTQTAVYPATLVGEAVRIPGAARIWFSHNHPSGNAELSSADRMLNQSMSDVFRGSGIEPMGLLAVAGDRFAYQSAEPGGDATAHEPIPASDSAAEGARKGRKIAAPSPDGVTVPVIEREIAPDSDVSGHVISAPSDAIDIGRVFYDRAKAPGLMLVNGQHRVIGWVPLPTNTMGDLRNTGGLHAIYRAVSESNAAGAVLVHGGEPALSQTVGGRQVTVAQNIGAALDKIDARLLDSVDVVRRESAASRGAGLSAGPVYARGQSAQPGGLPVRRVTAIAAAVSRAWTNPPEVVVIADMQDARVPQRVRDYDAEQRSQGAGEPEGFFLDGKVYLVASQMATPADVVRVLAHEALGHYGLRGLFGGELGKILDQIAAVRRAEVDARRTAYGLPDTAAGRRVAAEEVLAGMAQTSPQLGFVRRAVAAIRTWLRGLGLNLRMTDDEIIRSFILPAQAWVTRGGGESAMTAPSFSRSAARATDVTPLGFYSDLARQIGAINARAQPAQSWVQQIDALTKKGVKPDEIEWSGIREFLALQQGKVTKDAILEYLAGNGVRIEEVTLGVVRRRNPERAPLIERRRELLDRRAALPSEVAAGTQMITLGAVGSAGRYTIWGASLYRAEPDVSGRLIWKKKGAFGREASGQKMSQKLRNDLTALAKSEGIEIGRVRHNEPVVQSEESRQISAELAKVDAEIAKIPAMIGDVAKFGEYRVPGQSKNYLELLLTLPEPPKKTVFTLYEGGNYFGQYATREKAEAARLSERRPTAMVVEILAPDDGSVFRSGHWDQPNVVAHVRIDERTDADGKRVLFINELQSDWGQRGRKEGFRDLTPDEAARKSVLDAKPVAEWSSADMDWYNTRVNDAERDGVPRAPFVEKTDAWVALALKRVIRYAVDNGFDRVAIASGEQAAEMFDLSRVVNSIEWDEAAVAENATRVRIEMPQGAQTLYVDNADGKIIRGGGPLGDVAGKALDDVIGKEIAEKIAGSASGTMSGLDLKVGGAGMRGFYDKIVPTVLKEVLKKVGGRLATVTLPGTESRDALAAKVYGAGETYRNLPSESKRRIDAMFDDRKHEQLGFDITPEMRDTVMDQGMPMFSRRPTVAGVQAAVDQASQAIRGATLQGTWQKVVNAWTDKKPLALQLLNRRQIVDIYGDLLPQLRAYSNETQQYDADKNESAAVADELANRWRKLSDADALADAMHDATLAQFDPDVDQAADQDQEALKARFDGLTAGAKEIYREVRSAYINHWNKVKEAIRARIERADMSENDRRVMMEQFRDQFLQPIQGVYFPLARFGDYVITAKDAEGQRVVVFAETLSEAQAEHARMVGEFTDVSKVTLRKEYNAARDAVSKDFVRKLFETIDETSTDGQQAELLKDAVNQLYLTSLPDVSWAKHGIHRKGVAGYSRDARRAFAANMFHGGYHLSKLRHVDVLQDHLRAMQEHIDSKRDVADYDSITAQQVLNEMVKRHERVMNPDSNKIANTATALGFVWFLGLSPASAIVNLSQTALVAYPIMGARFGFGKAAAALTQASKETAQARNDLRGRYGEEENAAIIRAIIEGLIDVTQAHDLASISEGRDNQLHGALSPVMRAASFMFHQAEKFNRQATFIASYRLARQAGEDAAQAYETAREMTYKGHFDYACVDADTECLTLDGWKRHDELREGDVAIAVDADGRAVESRVSAVNIHRGVIPVTKFQSRQFSMVLTDNHDAVVQTYNSRDRKWQAIRKVRADSLKPSQHILRAPSAAIARTAPKYGKDFAALLGWVAAEGWYAKYRKSKVAHDVRLAQSLSHNLEYVDEIRGILDRLGGEYKEYVSEKRQMVFFVLRRSLGARVQAAMPDKLLTAAMLRDMPADEMGALVDAFLKGDGSNRGRGDWSVGQKDGQNLDVIQAMAVMLGMRASQSPVDKQGRGMLHLGRPEAGHRSHVRPMSKERAVVDMVWCPTTEHGTWVARRGGRVFVTGNSSNRPRVMMGPVARVALLFKQYGQNMIYTLARNTVLASRGDREALRTLSGILVAHGLTAGLMGLPLSSVLMGIASIIGSSDDEPWDAEVAFRNYLADAVGPRMGEVIAKGVFRSVLPGDISSRVGLDSLLIHDIDLTLDPSRAWQRIMEAAGGPLVGASINASRGVGDLVRGDLLLGIQGMLPKAVADGIKTLRYGMEGVKDRTGIEVLDEVRIRDMIAQLSGFSPARVREAYDARRAIYGTKRALDDRREELLATFSKAVIKHDDETRLRALQEIQHFNQVNPTVPITSQSLLRSIQNRMRRQAEASSGVYLPRRQRHLEQEGRFANVN